MELVRKQTYITSAQDRAVKLLAQRQGTTEAEILRKALDQFLAREGIGETQDPFADLIGMFEGPSEVDHDDIYR
jgi:hypothetical protein